jgi:fructosamine-3-kinase
MGPVIFRCPKTQKEFDSGFRAEAADLKAMPREAVIRLRCVICAGTHEFKFANGRVKENVTAQPR